MSTNLRSPGGQEPFPAFGVGDILLVTVLLVGGLFGLLVAQSSPVAAVGVAGVVVLGHRIGRVVAGIRRARNSGRAWRYHIPATSICVEMRWASSR